MDRTKKKTDKTTETHLTCGLNIGYHGSTYYARVCSKHFTCISSININPHLRNGYYFPHRTANTMWKLK